MHTDCTAPFGRNRPRLPRGSAVAKRVRRSARALLALALTLAAPARPRPRRRSTRSSRRLARAGGVSGGYVLDTTTGRTLAAVRADTPRIPASVNKLFTTSTALLRFGPDATLTTRVLGVGTLDDAGTWHGDLYLRGGGDPTFGSASFDRLAYGLGSDRLDARRARARRRHRARERPRPRRRVVARHAARRPRDRLRARPRHRRPARRPAVQPRPRARGRQRAAAPAGEVRRAAADAGAVARAASRVRQAPAAGAAPADAEQLASVDSPTMATLVRLTLVPSDNLLAEMLLKDVGAHFGGAGSTVAGVRVVSARSRASRPAADRRRLGPLAHRPHLAAAGRSCCCARCGRTPTFRAALPVAGRSGTLAERMRRTSAQDRCQAKTGTLSNVSALAGYCRTPKATCSRSRSSRTSSTRRPRRPPRTASRSPSRATAPAGRRPRRRRRPAGHARPAAARPRPRAALQSRSGSRRSRTRPRSRRSAARRRHSRRARGGRAAARASRQQQREQDERVEYFW